jgi:hypothetical protein
MILVLHPQHKLRYFKTAGWEDKWINVAEQIVRDEFKQKYADLPGESSGDKDNSILSPKKKKVHNIFNNLPSLAAPKAAELHDKLAHYLSTDYLSIPGMSLTKVLN